MTAPKLLTTGLTGTLVAIESPLAGETVVNIAYAKRCMRDALSRGEAPFASHLLYAQDGILDDLVPEERTLGMDAGFFWGRKANMVAFYVDRGVSMGMRRGFERVRKTCQCFDVRAIDREVTARDFADLLLGSEA